MADFCAWGPFELKISIGELANAAAIVFTGIWVASRIESRHANQRAVKDLVVALCREFREHLGDLSRLIESECSPAKDVSVAARSGITGCLQRLSNSMHSIEIASQRGKLAATLSLEDLKALRESLRTQITDPLAQGLRFDQAMIRQIEGTIRETREAAIVLEITLHKK